MSLITLGLTMIFLSIVYLFVKRRYFSLRQSLPGIDPHLFFGNILQTRCLHDESYINIQSKLKQSFGDVYQYWLGPYHYYVFNKVEHAEHIFKNRTIYDLPSLTFGLQFPSGLVSIKGSDYQRHARVILPMFRKSKVQHHFQIILNATDKLIDQWLIQLDQNRPILNRDIGQQSKRLLLQIISASAFDYDLLSSSSTDKSIEIDRLAEALNIFTSMYDSLVKLTGIPTIFLHIYMKLNKEYQSAVEILRAYVTDIIERACKQLQRNDELYLRERFVIYRMIDAWLLNKESLDRRTSDKSDKGSIVSMPSFSSKTNTSVFHVRLDFSRVGR